jgi:hypothetical protein
MVNVKPAHTASGPLSQVQHSKSLCYITEGFMGKLHCLYCGRGLPDDGPSVRIGKHKLICMKCYYENFPLYSCTDEAETDDEVEQCHPEESDTNLFGEKMNEFEVTFHLISGRQITMSEMTPDKTAGDYTLYLISNPYSVFYTDDGHTVVVNMANVTSFNVRKKEKEE